MLNKQDVIKYTSSLTLLFVEDNREVRESAIFLLEDIFKNIILAVDGQDGIDKFKKNNVDVIITDIDMPVMNGMDMIEKIKEIDNNDVPIIILSALMRTEYFIKSIKLGVKGYLLKPLDIDALFESFDSVTTKIHLKDEMLENMKLKERMELALVGSNTAILDWNLTNNDFYISQNWKEMLGYSDFEVPNIILSWRERVHRDDRKLVYSSLRETKKEKNIYFENIHRLRHKNGRWVWILGRAQLQYDENGTAVRMIGTHTNITDTKQMEVELNNKNIVLQEHDKYIQSVIDNLDNPTILIKEDYTVELMNSTLRNQLSTMNIADKDKPKCYEISHCRSTPCNRDEHPCPLRDVMDTKESVSVVHEHYKPDGSKQQVELTATPLFDKNKKCIGVVELAKDIADSMG